MLDQGEILCCCEIFEIYVFYPMLVREIENADVSDEVVEGGGCVVRWV